MQNVSKLTNVRKIKNLTNRQLVDYLKARIGAEFDTDLIAYLDRNSVGVKVSQAVLSTFANSAPPKRPSINAVLLRALIQLDIDNPSQ